MTAKIETHEDEFSAEASIDINDKQEVQDIDTILRQLIEAVTKKGHVGIVRIKVQNLSAYAYGDHMDEPHRSRFTRHMNEVMASLEAS